MVFPHKSKVPGATSQAWEPAAPTERRCPALMTRRWRRLWPSWWSPWEAPGHCLCAPARVLSGAEGKQGSQVGSGPGHPLPVPASPILPEPRPCREPGTRRPLPPLLRDRRPLPPPLRDGLEEPRLQPAPTCKRCFLHGGKALIRTARLLCGNGGGWQTRPLLSAESSSMPCGCPRRRKAAVSRDPKSSL